MKTKAACLVAFALASACTAAFADYTVSNEGTWPDTWPAELEPLRKQARTLEGPLLPHEHYAIHFTSREQFESAWPHLVKVKSQGARVVLVRAPNFFLGKEHQAGVVVHAPPRGRQANETTKDPTYIELIVDGEIVDLNRIALPADTPIIDQRFADQENQSPSRRGN